MTSYVPPIKNGAGGWIGYVSLAPRTATGAFQSNPTLAAGDVKLSIDGGALANLGTLPAVTPASSKLVKITLSQAETNGDNLTIIFSDAAGAEWCDLTINLQTVARQIDDLAFPTVSGRSLDVTATGAAGVDWGNVENPTTAVNLSATNIDVDQVVASVSGAVGSVTGNVGGNVTGSVGSVAAGGITASSIATGAIDADALAADAVAEIADGVWDEDATAHQTQGTFGQAIGDPGADSDSIWALANTNLDATVSSRLASASYTAPPSAASIADAVWDEAQADHVGVGTFGITASEIADILVDTAEIGAAGAGLSAIPWNASWDAEVQSEVDDALVAQNLDHLVKIAVDTNFATTVHADSVIGQIADNGAGFDRTTDSLEAIRDRGDAAWITATGFSTHSAADVWSVATRSLTVLDEDSTTLDLDATLRAAMGLAAANLDTQLAAIVEDTGTTLPAQITALNNLSAAQVNAEVVDALATDTYAEPGQGTPAATLSLSGKIGYLYKAWRNRSTMTSSEYALYADDAVTKDQEAAVSDNGTTFERGEVATGA